VTPDSRGREPSQPAAGEGTLRRYDMWVRTILSPVLVAALPVRADRAAVPRCSLHRLWVPGDREVPSVVRRLAEAGVEVLEIRSVHEPG
jgi:hypothetical protein